MNKRYAVENGKESDRSQRSSRREEGGQSNGSEEEKYALTDRPAEQWTIGVQVSISTCNKAWSH